MNRASRLHRTERCVAREVSRCRGRRLRIPRSLRRRSRVSANPRFERETRGYADGFAFEDSSRSRGARDVRHDGGGTPFETVCDPQPASWTDGTPRTRERLRCRSNPSSRFPVARGRRSDSRVDSAVSSDFYGGVHASVSRPATAQTSGTGPGQCRDSDIELSLEKPPQVTFVLIPRAAARRVAEVLAGFDRAPVASSVLSPRADLPKTVLAGIPVVCCRSDLR